MFPSDRSRRAAARLHSAVSAFSLDVPFSPSKSSISSTRKVTLGGVAVFLCLAQSLTAATYTWGRGAAGTFSWNNNATFGLTNGNNWNASSAGAFPNAIGDIANLTPGAGGNAQIYRLGQNITVGALTVGSGNSGTGAQTLEAGGLFSLIFDNGGNNSTLSHNNTTAVATISAPVVIGGTGTLSVSNASAGTGNLIISGEISGTSSNLTLTAGNLILTGANTYSGTTTVSAGTLRIGNGGTTGSLSSSGSIVNNGTLLFNRSNAITQGADFGTISSGTGAVQHVGAGTLNLNAANVYAGGTVIGTGQNSSVLSVSVSNALGNGLVQLDTAGNGSTARLELRDGASLSNAINLPQRNNTSVAIQSVSGDNTLGGLIRIGAGGNQARVQSDDGILVLSGGVTTDSTSTRNLYLQGEGDGEVSGAISNNQSNAAGVVNVVKEGGGSWTNAVSL